MDVPTLSTFLSPILTVASVWNTEETGGVDTVVEHNRICQSNKARLNRRHFLHNFEISSP